MSTPAKTSANQRLLTIGTVTRRLQEEFPEISISKIRYLEDQGLLAPRRTQGGYRLFSGRTSSGSRRSCVSSATSFSRCG
jgi:hypothetical protein